MSDAGLTNGGFYKHFGSRNDLLRESLGSDWERFTCRIDATARETGLEGVLRFYLCVAHRDHPGVGCPSSALLPEIVRQPDDVREMYTERLKAFVAMVAGYLPGPGSPEAKSTARAMFGLAVGSLQLARAVSDPALSNQILDDAVKAAMAMSNRMKA